MAGKTFVNGSSTRNDRNQSEVTVVLGAQWGDEGKGRMVDFLCQRADVVCRCQVRVFLAGRLLRLVVFSY